MTKSLLILSVLCVLSIAGCSRAPENPNPAGPAVISKAEADQLQKGMSLEQVQKVIGDPGKKLTKGDMPDRSMMTYSWQNPDGSGLTVMFENGQMQSAVPINLMG